MSLSDAQPEQPEDPALQGQLPSNLTYDPTQGRGTAAWQLSLRHGMEVNARQRKN